MKTFAESTDKKFAADILSGAPQQGQAWLNFDHSVFDTETAIPRKYKELIAIAVALSTQCPYCIEKHVEHARKLGINKQELAETIMITSALKSGSALGYGLLGMKFLNQGKDR